METELNNNVKTSRGLSIGMIGKSKSNPSLLTAIKLENYDAPPGVEKQHLIKVEDLERHVASMLESGGFKEQYHVLKTGYQKPCTCGEKPENKDKNRYPSLLPYDENRVVLQKLKNDPHSDYINASYIDGYRRKKSYICTQGPLENTLGDFWRMIWQEDVCVVIMTANIIENGNKKCEKYWPDKFKKYADITVTLVREEVFIDYTLRSFKIQKAGSSNWRIVRQYHYTAWPDHGIPSYPPSLVFMLNEIEDYQKKQQKLSPVVLHCSAGIGRTGTVIVLASALEMAADLGKVDILGILYKVRQQRVNAIETLEQFIFVYKALVDYLFGDIPNRTSTELVLYFNKLRQMDQETKKTGLQQQFERLKSFDGPKFQERCTVALAASNRTKNRNCDIIPPDDGRPILKTNPSTNYINAVHVPDYAKSNQFVVTQYPLSDTTTDFWQLLYDLGSNTIVVLNELSKKDESSPMFWPPSGSTYFGSFKLENVSTEHEYISGVLVRKLKIRNTKGSSKSRTVKMFHLYGWHPEDYIPPQIDFIVNLLNRVQQWHKKSGQKQPTVVTCYDGCRASGFFCAASHLSGQVKQTERVDVFQAVRTVRLNRPAFIPTVEQYRWLYELACFMVTNKKLLK